MQFRAPPTARLPTAVSEAAAARAAGLRRKPSAQPCRMPIAALERWLVPEALPHLAADVADRRDAARVEPVSRVG
jgi:hypothetical protein